MDNQNKLIDYLVEKCTSMPEVKALYLKGSIARECGDKYSDVDFYCLIEEGFIDEMLVRRVNIIHDYKSVLFEEHVNFGVPQIIVIYEDNIHLDFYTAHEIPTEGSDSIKVLYDPNNLLTDYKVVSNTVEKSEVIENLNSIIYTAQEVYAAFCRGDVMWCNRLISHMIADLGLVYCVLLQPKKPIVHLKGVWNALPESIRYDIECVMKSSAVGRYADASSLLLNHCLKLINIEFQEYNNVLYLGYLEYMINVFDELNQ